MLKAIRDECANESMTNTNPQTVVPARVSQDCSERSLDRAQRDPGIIDKVPIPPPEVAGHSLDTVSR
jgi:hypothetical protein